MARKLPCKASAQWYRDCRIIQARATSIVVLEHCPLAVRSMPHNELCPLQAGPSLYPTGTGTGTGKPVNR